MQNRIFSVSGLLEMEKLLWGREHLQAFGSIVCVKSKLVKDVGETKFRWAVKYV